MPGQRRWLSPQETSTVDLGGQETICSEARRVESAPSELLVESVKIPARHLRRIRNGCPLGEGCSTRHRTRRNGAGLVAHSARRAEGCDEWRIPRARE